MIPDNITKEHYKWLALIPGWFIGGFLGAIAAYFLLDTLTSEKKEDTSFDIALLRLCTLLIQADGKVEPEEIKVVKDFFVRTFGKRKANEVFKNIKTSHYRNYAIDQIIPVLKIKLSPAKYYSVFQMLYAVAASDGIIAKSEDLFIEEVALQFGYSKERLKSIKNQFIKNKTKSNIYSQKIMDSLSVLGLKPGVPHSDVKSAYRKLVKEYHPDRLVGMSSGIKDLSKEKFILVQEAYEHLNKNYV